MSQPTRLEKISDLVAELGTRAELADEGIKRAYERTDALLKNSEKHREYVEKLREGIDKLRDDWRQDSKSIEVHKHLIERLESRIEETDRRRWAFIMLFVGSLLTLIANLVLFALRLK